MPWELRKKRLLGEPPILKLRKRVKAKGLLKRVKVPKVLRPPKPGDAPPGHEYYWRDE
jgi:hypothetical protein